MLNVNRAFGMMTMTKVEWPLENKNDYFVNFILCGLMEEIELPAEPQRVI